ncbi:hypothetical protein [Lignipirellula cremea]|uniref:Uncharacterized protein n=1 Tax=Lignipirellula cremea TaxID=2528010 RepID=A0A518DVH6_9BACT|nr:hypothetical protein [Lignipirellula cremea]QDU95840.1 hypothetical protein Pla8534_36590 [Lignipirellula cremea]
MKCPTCSKQHKVKEGMKCLCGYEFVFNPKEDGISDGQFLAVVRGASSNGEYYFTMNQFHAEHRRRSTGSPLKPAIISAVTLGLGIGLYAMASDFFGILLIIVGVIAAISALVKWGAAPKTFNTWQKLTERWRQAKGAAGLEKLIAGPTLHKPPPDWQEQDIYDYGFERLLIVERDELVDLFVLNKLHAEQRTLIFSESGYPLYLLPPAQKTLDANPTLPVFLLHNASPSGEQMKDRIENWSHLNLAGHPITDLGLCMTDIARMKGMKKIKADQDQGGTAVDLLKYATLAGGLGLALDQQISLGGLLLNENAPNDGGASGGNFG